MIILDFVTKHPLYWVPKRREELLAVVLRKTREGSEAPLGPLDLDVHPSLGTGTCQEELLPLVTALGHGEGRDPSGHYSPDKRECI